MGTQLDRRLLNRATDNGLAGAGSSLPGSGEREKAASATTTPPTEERVRAEGDCAALLKEFGIEVVGEGKVRLSLGKTSRIDFLRKVQEVASELHGQPAINTTSPSSLEEWARDAAFTNIPSEGLEIGVDGNVKGSTCLARWKQARKGWNNVDLCDLAVAHAAYFLATGEDLFSGNVVRARNLGLSFSRYGLYVYFCDDVGPYHGVAASAALPARN